MANIGKVENGVVAVSFLCADERVYYPAKPKSVGADLRRFVEKQLTWGSPIESLCTAFRTYGALE